MYSKLSNLEIALVPFVSYITDFYMTSFDNFFMSYKTFYVYCPNCLTRLEKKYKTMNSHNFLNICCLS